MPIDDAAGAADLPGAPGDGGKQPAESAAGSRGRRGTKQEHAGATNSGSLQPLMLGAPASSATSFVATSPRIAAPPAVAGQEADSSAAESDWCLTENRFRRFWNLYVSSLAESPAHISLVLGSARRVLPTVGRWCWELPVETLLLLAGVLNNPTGRLGVDPAAADKALQEFGEALLYAHSELLDRFVTTRYVRACAPQRHSRSCAMRVGATSCGLPVSSSGTLRWVFCCSTAARRRQGGATYSVRSAC